MVRFKTMFQVPVILSDKCKHEQDDKHTSFLLLLFLEGSDFTALAGNSHINKIYTGTCTRK